MNENEKVCTITTVENAVELCSQILEAIVGNDIMQVDPPEIRADVIASINKKLSNPSLGSK